jgi:hypothetical protein
MQALVNPVVVAAFFVIVAAGVRIAGHFFY